MTPEQITLVKNDMVTGPLAAQIAPLMDLGPIVDTLYDWPAGTPFQWPANIGSIADAVKSALAGQITGATQYLPFLNHDVVTWHDPTTNEDRMFIALRPVPADVFAKMTDADKATLIVSHVRSSQDAAISALYNVVSGTETLALQYADKNDVLAIVELAVMAIPAVSAAIQQKWAALGPMLISLLGAATGGIEQSKASGLQAAAADGLITPAQADSPWLRLCTHAEKLLGPGVTMTAQMIGEARNG